MDIKFHCGQKGNLQVPIIMVHGDESNKAFSKYLPQETPFYYFTHMGNKNHHFLYNSIEEIAYLYCNKLKEVFKGKTLILSGYSIGGVIAYEMAYQLEQQGYDIASVILLDSKSPTLSEKKEYHNRQIKWNEYFIVRAFKLIYKKALIKIANFLKIKLPKELFYFYRMQCYRSMRAKYHPDNISANLFLIKSKEENYKDVYMGWNTVKKDSIKLFLTNGNHHKITLEPFVKEVVYFYNRIYKMSLKQVTN